MDPLLLIGWVPSPQFLQVSHAISREYPCLAPSSTCLSAMPLTCHYVMWIANMLDSFGFPSYSLYCLGWLRVVLISMPIPSLGNIHAKDIVLAAIHFKVGDEFFLQFLFMFIFAGNENIVQIRSTAIHVISS